MSDDNNKDPQGGNQDGLQKLLDKHKGDAMALSLQLWGELLDYRRKNADLRGKVPADGARVLSKEEAAQFDAFLALSLKPEEVKAKVEAHDAVTTENATLKRDGMLRAAEAAGYSYQALKDFDALEGQAIESYETKDETKDGKTVKAVLLKVGGKEVSLDEYAKEKRPALATVLKSDAAPQGGGRDYVSQSAGGKPPGPKTREQVIAEEKQKAYASGQYSM